jgi:two-component system NarL family sensor kinase
VLGGLAALDSGTENSCRFVHEGVGSQKGVVFEICLTRTRVSDRIVTVVTRTDITELRSLRELRERLDETLTQTRAQERRRLARELHDSTMQQLHCLTLALGQLRRSFPPKQANDIVDDMEAILGHAQSELRTMSYLAHPPLLEELGLRRAIQALVDGFTRRSGLHTTFQWKGADSGGEHLAEVALYRIVQEALSNVHRHARADCARVSVSIGNGTIEARVVDDGVGMPKRPVDGVGMAGMRARLEELGGALSVHSSKFGTEIIAAVPRSASRPVPACVVAHLQVQEAQNDGLAQLSFPA